MVNFNLFTNKCFRCSPAVFLANLQGKLRWISPSPDMKIEASGNKTHLPSQNVAQHPMIDSKKHHKKLSVLMNQPLAVPYKLARETLPVAHEGWYGSYRCNNPGSDWPTGSGFASQKSSSFQVDRKTTRRICKLRPESSAQMAWNLFWVEFLLLLFKKQEPKPNMEAMLDPHYPFSPNAISVQIAVK